MRPAFPQALGQEEDGAPRVSRSGKEERRAALLTGWEVGADQASRRSPRFPPCSPNPTWP